MNTDLYKALGVTKDASPAEIKQAYRSLSQQHHPDKAESHDDGERFLEIQAAYDVLGDAEKRARYDQTGTVESVQSKDFTAFGLISQTAAKLLTTNKFQRKDYIKLIRADFEAQIENGEQMINNMEEALGNLNELLGAYEGDAILAAIEQQIGNITTQLQSAKDQMDAFNRAQEIMEEYKYLAPGELPDWNQAFMSEDGEVIIQTGGPSCHP